ncbi:MAG: hypothetical protein LBI59_11930 [Candidatus Accumulibacter sp.]|jgi:hypothetical protein|nr:hypothetical protein [Accumulibacter sp.]
MSRTVPAGAPDFFDEALRRVDSSSPTGPPLPPDGFLFSGNRHESVPRSLFFDRRLTPLERNTWQVIRLKLNDDGVTAFPTYEELRPLLSSMPCAPKASHETVARALNILRLTRWLSLVRRRRDHRTGRLQGNLYVLHDEPLTPFEAIQLDSEYLSLLSRELDHAGKSIRLVGQQVLRELGNDPLLAGKILPSRLSILMQRMAGGNPGEETYPQEEASRKTYPQGEAMHESEEGEKALLRNGESPSSESEEGGKPAPEALLRIPKQDSTVLSTSTVLNINNIKEVRTVPRAREGEEGLQWPQRFLELKEEQQAGARVALGQVGSGQRQAVLDEWDARCRVGRIRHPAAYLFGIIQKALRGEFKVWAGQNVEQSTERSVVAPYPSETEDKAAAAPPVNSEAARERLAHLRAMLRNAPYLPGPP